MRFFPFLFAAVALLTLWFGLRPFNFMARNDVQVDTANHRALFNQTFVKGLQESRGMAFTSQPVSFNSGKGITLHIKLTPLRRPDGLGHIVSFYDGQQQAVFSITQWQDHLELFSRRTHSAKGYQEVSMRNMLPPGKSLTLTVSSFYGATLLFADGRLVQSFPGFSLFENSDTISGQLILGNNAQGTQPWHGSIETITIYNQSDQKALDGLPGGHPLIRSTFDALENGTVPNSANTGYALQVPERFTPLTRTLLISFPLKELGSVWLRNDILINIFGFMPLSLCFAQVVKQTRLRPWMQFAVVVLLCFHFSLAIETAQAFLPSRDSSLLDLLCNILGGGLATLTFFVFRGKKQVDRTSVRR